MSEKTVRELERELKAARVRERKEHTDKVTVSRDYSIGGIDRDTTVEKKNPDSADIPDATSFLSSCSRTPMTKTRCTPRR